MYFAAVPQPCADVKVRCKSLLNLAFAVQLFTPEYLARVALYGFSDLTVDIPVLSG